MVWVFPLSPPPHCYPYRPTSGGVTGHMWHLRHISLKVRTVPREAPSVAVSRDPICGIRDTYGPSSTTPSRGPVPSNLQRSHMCLGCNICLKRCRPHDTYTTTGSSGGCLPHNRLGFNVWHEACFFKNVWVLTRWGSHPSLTTQEQGITP